MAASTNDIWQELATRLRSLPPQWRMILTLVGVCVVAAACLFANFERPPTYASILAGSELNSSELLTIETAFATGKLSDYKIDDNVIRVPAAEKHLYLQALSDANALPHSFYGLSHDAVAQSTFSELSSSRDLRIGQAREMQAALQIRQLPFVEDAFVRFDETSGRGMRAAPQVTALVSVIVRDGQTVTGELRATIRDILLGLKAGLTADNITITDLRSGYAYRGSLSDELDEITAAHTRRKRRIQQEWTEQVKNVVSFVPEARVVVAVDLPVERIADRVPTESPADNGRSATLPVGQASVAHRADGAHTTATRQHLSLQWGEETVAVSIGIPSSYLHRVWQSRHARRHPELNAVASESDLASLESEVRQKIYAAVKSLLPILPRAMSDNAAGGNLLSTGFDERVTVTTFDDVAPEPILTADWRANLDGWFKQHPLAIYLGPLAAALLVCWMLFWPGRRQEPPRTAPYSLRVAADTIEPVGSSTPSDDLRHRLQSMVDRDPHIAAEALAEWIKKTG